TDCAVNAIFAQSRIDLGQIIARPDHEVMRQLCQQNQHLLRDKFALVAVCQVQTLLVTFVLRLETSAPSVISVQGGQRSLLRCWLTRHRAAGQTKEHCISECGEDQTIAPLPSALRRPHQQLACGGIKAEWLFDPSELTVGNLRISEPFADRSTQFVGAPPTGQLDQEMIALSKHPVYVGVITGATINAHNSGAAFSRIQGERSLRLLQEIRQAAVKLAFAVIKAIDDDLIVITRQGTSQLATATILATSEVAFSATFAQASGRHPRHINIEQQLFLRVIVLIAARMLLQDSTDGFAHLRDIRRTTTIERVADRRLFGAAITPKGALHSLIRSHACIDLNYSCASGQDVDQTVKQFFQRRMPMYLLFDLELCADFRPDAHLLNTHSDRDKARAGRKFDLLFVHHSSSQVFPAF